MPSFTVPLSSGNPMCGQRLSTAYTFPPSKNNASECPPTRTARRPRCRKFSRLAARTKGPVSVFAAMARPLTTSLSCTLSLADGRVLASPATCTVSALCVRTDSRRVIHANRLPLHNDRVLFHDERPRPRGSARHLAPAPWPELPRHRGLSCQTARAADASKTACTLRALV